MEKRRNPFIFHFSYFFLFFRKNKRKLVKMKKNRRNIGKKRKNERKIKGFLFFSIEIWKKGEIIVFSKFS